MREGKFKVFSTLTEWFEEKRLYHRDDHQRIVKERDDLICATRYAYMMRRNAIPMSLIKKLNYSTGSTGTVISEFDPYGD
jgi:hypothetical protein